MAEIFRCQRYRSPQPQEEMHGTPHGSCVLRLSGPVTISTFFQFQSFVGGSTSRKLILDLASVPHVDSAGIGALAGAFVNHQQDGRCLALVEWASGFETLCK